MNCSLPIIAKNTNINQELGEITINLNNTQMNSSKENISFGIKKVADIDNGKYVIDSFFQDLNIDFNQLKTSNDLETSIQCLLSKTKKPDILLTTDKNGIAKANNLKIGLYLIYAMNADESENIQPLLVSIPTFDMNEKTMIYAIHVFPKGEPLPLLRIYKTDSITNKEILNKNFEFSMYSNKLCNQLISKSSANINEGYATFKIKYGTWYIKETTAPIGYELSSQIIKVTYNNEGLFINDKYYPKDNQYYSVYFPNIPASLPSKDTSDKSFMNLYMIAFVISIFNIVFWGFKKIEPKTKEHDD